MGGPLPIHPKLVHVKLVLLGYKDLENPKPSIQKKAISSVWKEYLTLIVLSGANSTKFADLILSESRGTYLYILSPV